MTRMPATPPNVRSRSLALLAASVPLDPEPARLAACLTRPELDWDDVLYLADGHGITPRLYRLWDSLGLGERIPADARARMARAYADNAMRNADAAREFRELMEWMARAKVETLALKGVPLLYQLYPDPAERVLYDFDLLARDSAAAARGHAMLLASGFTPLQTKAVVTKHLAPLWRLNGFVRRGYLFDPAQPRPVELHLELWDVGWRGLDVRALPRVWEKARRVEVDGVQVGVLGTADTFIHLCVHLATHMIEREARLGQALDIARLLAQSAGDLDWTRVVQASAAARVSRLVYLALCATHTLTGASLPPAPFVAQLRAETPPRLAAFAEQRAANDLLTMDFRKPNLSEAYQLTFAAARTPQECAGVLRYALLPSRAHLDREYGGHGIVPHARHIGRRGRTWLRSVARQRGQVW